MWVDKDVNRQMEDYLAIGDRNNHYPPIRLPEGSPSAQVTVTKVSKVRHQLSQGPVLLVIQTESEIVVQNISRSPVAIRVSWDRKDSFGTGLGTDSFINNWVPPEKSVNRKFQGHTSVQVWSWGRSGENNDSCDRDLILTH